MIFLVHSETETGNLAQKLGAPEYSYYFVLKEFRPVLEELGLVVPVNDPENQVDAIWGNALRHGEASVFLTFSPPHKSFVATFCPTVPIFAWEFDTLPRETWAVMNARTGDMSCAGAAVRSPIPASRWIR